MLTISHAVSSSNKKNIFLQKAIGQDDVRSLVKHECGKLYYKKFIENRTLEVKYKRLYIKKKWKCN